jgi:AI-2 transport protein TqsA
VVSCFAQLKAKQQAFRKLKQQNPAVYGHPVWNRRYEFPDLKDGAGLSEAEVDKFKEVYAMADPTHVGFLGHRQFTDMLKMLNIEVDEETLLIMFTEMDENDDGEIDFDEFVPSMVKHIDPEALDVLDQIQIGGLGTRMWSRGEVLWAANTGLLITSGGVVLAGLMYFSFMLVPLTIAYFCVFLFGPIMDFYNHTLKLGPGVGVLGTLVTVAFGFAALAYIVSSELGAVFGDPEFMAKLNGMVDDVYSSLNDSGVNVLREQDARYTSGEISATIGAFGESFNLFALIFLLTLYILSEKVEKKMFGDGAGIMPEIETMTTGYIGLKTALSFLTGAVVAAILLALQVKLAVMFGILSFVLNYIPNVGSMIAMFLPMPIVLVDDNLATWQKVLSFVGPGAVQGYVGNALEPVMFGKLLNMTPMSILFALVFWSSIWGLLGAILSVPLLGIQKICCSYANHPLAKIMLSMIREDATIDEAAEAANAGLPIPGIGGKDDEEDSEVAVANPMAAADEEDDDDE